MARNKAQQVEKNIPANVPEQPKGKAVPSKVAVLIDKATTLVIQRLDKIEQSLGSTYGMVSALGNDLLSGKVKAAQVAAWVQQHDQSDEGIRRAKEVVRQLGDYIREQTAERALKEGGKLTLRKANSKDARKFKEQGIKEGDLALLPPRPRPPQTPAGEQAAAKVGHNGKALAEAVRLFLTDKETPPAAIAEFREAVMPALKAAKFF